MNIEISEVRVETPTSTLWMIGGGNINVPTGEKEITFKGTTTDKDTIRDIEKSMHNNFQIQELTSKRGKLKDCSITSVGINYGHTPAECTIEGSAKDFLEKIEVSFRDCISEVEVYYYDKVKNEYKINPESLTLHEFNDYIMVDKL